MMRFSFLMLTIATFLTLICRDVTADDPPKAAVVAAEPAGHPLTLVRTGESRFGWKWLAARYDKEATGKLLPDRFPGTAEVFARLDRNWDGKLTPQDFDWSESGTLNLQKETAFALFKSADKNSDGRLTADEWQAVFAKAVKDGGSLNDFELEQLIFLPAVKKAERQTRSKGVESFLERQRKESRKAPELGDLAPDFSLRSPDGQASVQLSSFQGKRPVVLIFGSFT